MKKIISVCLFISVLFAWFSFQQSKWTAPTSADKQKNPTAKDETSLSAGKIIYVEQCKSCHGSKGKGDGPKSASMDVSCGNFTSDDFKKQTDGAIFWKINEGRKPMPSFKLNLNDKQKWNLVNYIRTLGEKPVKGK